MPPVACAAVAGRSRRRPRPRPCFGAARGCVAERRRWPIRSVLERRLRRRRRPRGWPRTGTEQGEQGDGRGRAEARGRAVGDGPRRGASRRERGGRPTRSVAVLVEGASAAAIAASRARRDRRAAPRRSASRTVPELLDPGLERRVGRDAGRLLGRGGAVEVGGGELVEVVAGRSWSWSGVRRLRLDAAGRRAWFPGLEQPGELGPAAGDARADGARAGSRGRRRSRRSRGRRGRGARPGPGTPRAARRGRRRWPAGRGGPRCRSTVSAAALIVPGTEVVGETRDRRAACGAGARRGRRWWRPGRPRWRRPTRPSKRGCPGRWRSAPPGWRRARRPRCRPAGGRPRGSGRGGGAAARRGRRASPCWAAPTSAWSSASGAMHVRLLMRPAASGHARPRRSSTGVAAAAVAPVGDPDQHGAALGRHRGRRSTVPASMPSIGRDRSAPALAGCRGRSPAT